MRRLVSLAVLSLLALAACHGGGGGAAPVPGALVLAAPLPADPNGEAAGLVDFGRVELGRNARVAIRVANPGEAAVVLGPPDAAAPFFADVPAAGLEVPAGGQVSLELLFVPATAGVAEALVVLRAGEATLPLRLRGEGVPGGPCRLQADPPFLDFGQVGPMVETTGRVELFDVGEGPCVFEDPVVEGDAFAPGPGPVRGVTLLPGGPSLPVAVRFVPPAEGTYQGTLRVSAGVASVEVPLSGKGGPAGACFAPAGPTSWSMTHPRCSAAPFVVGQPVPWNDTDRTVGLASVDLIAAPDAGLAYAGISGLPVSIPPGGRLEAVLQDALDALDAAAVGPFGADGAFRLSSPGCLPYEQPFHVDGYADSVAEDFSQPPRTDLDLLLVVDDPPGMAFHEAELRALANAIGAAVVNPAGGIDLHVGVTTTATVDAPDCPAADGRLLPLDGTGPRVLSPSTPGFADELARRLIGRGCATPGAGRGLEAAVRALTPPLVDEADDPRHPEVDDGNAGFRRPGAPLRILFVAVDEDTSPGAAEDYFQALRGLDGFRQAFAIAGPAGGCPGAADGARYRTVAARSGGSSGTVCGTWTPPTGNLVAASPRFNRFDLAHPAVDRDGDGTVEGDDDAVTVYVQGSSSPEFDGQGLRRWAYDPAPPGIVFEPAAIPPPFAPTQVKYLAECPR